MITRQDSFYSDEEILKELNPLVRDWFKSGFGEFALPQKYAIPNIHNRLNTLVSAPTGSGKTLTAFLSILNELINLSDNSKLEDKVYCVYVSPLKALNNDIEKNLNAPLKELEQLAGPAGGTGRKLGIRVMVRTGDTKSSEKSKMLKTPPHILITTPESLAIILNAPKFKEKLVDVKWVIVDEIHALAENKRGVHLSLTLERLQNLAGRFIRIGLSATISPLEKIAEFLVGYEKGEARDCVIVDAQALKKLDIKVLSPVPDLIKASQEEIHSKMYKLLDELIQNHKTTLIFTNTRSGTERVVHHLKTKFAGRYFDNIGAHHSSLSAEHRLDIENKLKNGELKVVVSSTSLELGIDIGYIDLVILLGSPKSVARALQRIGRSGHKLHDKAVGRIVVMDRDDLVECSVLLKNALEGNIDEIRIPENCLDVLAQHIYGIAINEQQYIENVYELVKRSYCYRNLKKEDYNAVLDYLAGKYVELEQRNVYAKIWVDENTGMIGRKSRTARVIYSTNIGTIPEESYITVKVGNIKIGMIDEGFLERLKKGDIFVLGGKIYRLDYCRGMTCQVSPSAGPPTVPSWFSEQLPLSFGLAMEVQKFRRFMEERITKPEQEVKDFIRGYLYVDENSVNSIYQYFKEQYLYALIPNDKKILVEYYETFKTRHVIFHTLFGRRVNDALSRAVAYVISRRQHKNVGIGLTDNGFYLTIKDKVQVIQSLDELTPDNMRDILERAIEKTDVLARRFRHCATRSLMILRSYKGRQKSVGRQQMGSRILLSYVKKISEDFSILKEARREVLEDLMDIKSATWVVKQIKEGRIKVKVVSNDIPSPFAFGMIAQGYMDMLRIEERTEFVKRMHEAILIRIRDREVTG
ncbi:MAG: ATP-dependent helicase [Candidatus Altiarchaeales archaeon]|nr:ATP-dependent helicase [Candidatus Altiarchaeales archaeon]